MWILFQKKTNVSLSAAGNLFQKTMAQQVRKPRIIDFRVFNASSYESY